MNDTISERKKLLVEVAKLYYVENMSQQQISDKLHMSRSNISRLLKSCKDKNVVEIKINDALSREPILAAKIKKTFSLKEVLIATSDKRLDRCQESVGALAAVYLGKVLKDGMMLGTTWGRTTYYTAFHMKPDNEKKVNVIQLVGGMANKTSETDGQEVVKRFARKTNGVGYIVQAPHLVKTKRLKELLMQEDAIIQHFKKFGEVDIALLGIGVFKMMHSAQKQLGSLSKADMLQLTELGAVADICGKYFDINGQPCNAGINERAIAIELGMLKKVPTTIGLAAGCEKINATKSILNSGYLDVLIIDENLARNLIDFHSHV